MAKEAYSNVRPLGTAMTSASQSVNASSSNLSMVVEDEYQGMGTPVWGRDV